MDSDSRSEDELGAKVRCISRVDLGRPRQNRFVMLEGEHEEGPAACRWPWPQVYNVSAHFWTFAPVHSAVFQLASTVFDFRSQRQSLLRVVHHVYVAAAQTPALKIGNPTK